MRREVLDVVESPLVRIATIAEAMPGAIKLCYGESAVAALAADQRAQLIEPRGAFYAFFALDGLSDSTAFATRLLKESGVALAPGAAFGAGGEGYLRLCFAASEETLSQAFAMLSGHLFSKRTHTVA